MTSQTNVLRFSLLFRMTMAGALLFILLFKLDRAILGRMLLSVSPAYWIAAFSFIMFGVCLSCLKLSSMLKFQNERIPLTYLFRVYLISIFFGNFMPSTIGGDLFKFLYLKSRCRNYGILAASIFMERFTGFFALALIGAAGVLLSWKTLNEPMIGFTVLAMGFSIIVMTAMARIWRPINLNEKQTSSIYQLIYVKYLRKFHDGIYSLARSKNVFGIAITISCVFFAMVFLTTLIFAHGLGYRPNILSTIMIVALVQLFTMLPVSINGIGMREWAYVFLFGRYGIPAEAATAISLMVYISVLGVSLIGGILFLFGRNKLVARA